MAKTHLGAPKLPLTFWLISLASLFMSIFAVSYSITRHERVVYVDAIKLISKYKGVEAARSELNSKSQIWQSNLDTLRVELENIMSEYNRKKKSYSQREIKLMEDLIQTKQSQFVAYQQSIKEQYDKQDEAISTSILEKVNDYVKRYGEKNGYTIILAATHYGNIAYADKSLDLTDEILIGLNSEYQTLKK
jgi:outer membrane protein